MASRFHSTPFVFIAFLVSALVLGGCSENPLGPDENDPPPGPETRTVYTLSVSPRTLEVVGSCDTVLGEPTAGEFQYRIEVAGQGEAYSQESQDFDSRFGVTTSRVAGQFIGIERSTYTWSGLDEPEGVEVRLIGTEWDGVVRDGDMSRRAGTREIPFVVGSENRTVTIGATSACRLVLGYTTTWREIEVPV